MKLLGPKIFGLVFKKKKEKRKKKVSIAIWASIKEFIMSTIKH